MAKHRCHLQATWNITRKGIKHWLRRILQQSGAAGFVLELLIDTYWLTTNMRIYDKIGKLAKKMLLVAGCSNFY